MGVVGTSTNYWQNWPTLLRMPGRPHVHSPGESTFLSEMTSQPPS